MLTKTVTSTEAAMRAAIKEKKATRAKQGNATFLKISAEAEQTTALNPDNK